MGYSYINLQDQNDENNRERGKQVWGHSQRMKFFLKIELELGDTFWQRICLYFV